MKNDLEPAAAAGRTAMPAPVRPGRDYYRARADDYRARHPSPAGAYPPPDYYLQYGDCYARRFTQELRARLSAAGQAWLDATCRRLQALMEAQRTADPGRFAALEEDPPAFKRFAFGMHAQAYIECGIADLPLRDLVRIACAPDLRDVLAPAAARQAWRVVCHIAGRYCRAVLAGRPAASPWNGRAARNPAGPAVRVSRYVAPPRRAQRARRG